MVPLLKDEEEQNGLFTSSKTALSWSDPFEIRAAPRPITFLDLDMNSEGRGIVSFHDEVPATFEVDTRGIPVQDPWYTLAIGTMVANKGVVLAEGAQIQAWSGYQGVVATAHVDDVSEPVEGLSGGGLTGKLDAEALSDSQALFVWEQTERLGQSLWFAKYSKSGWAYFPDSVVASTVDAHDPVLVTNRKGGMYLTWSEEGVASSQRLHVARYDANNERFADISLDHPHLGAAQSVHAQVLANGDVVTFSLADSVEVAIYSVSSGSWSEREAPTLAGVGAVTDAQSARDADDNVVLSYLQTASSDSATTWWTTRFETSTDSWSPPFEMGVTDPHHRQLRVTPSGEAIVAWTEEGETRPYVRSFR